MHQQPRFSLLTALLFLTCIALAVGWLSTVERPKPPIRIQKIPPTDIAIREWPMTIAASEVGVFAQGYTWYLSVNSSGQAVLTVDNGKRNNTQQFQVSEEQLNLLREIFVFLPFFLLDEDQGEVVPDGSTQTLTITIGEVSKTVRIHYLMNWLNQNHEKLGDAAIATSVWMQIRGWFDHPDAVDTRAYDQRVIDAVMQPNPW